MKSYKLYVAKPLLVFYLMSIALWFLAGVAALIIAVLGGFGQEGPPWEVLATFSGVAIFVAYMWLRIPYEIKIHDDSTIEFKSVLLRTAISPAEIISVKANRYALGFINIRHSRGRVRLIAQMDGFHDFISAIKSLNPRVEIKGC